MGQATRGGIIGPHIMGPITPHLAVLRRWQPRLILVLDPDADGARALRQACPKAALIARIYAPDGEVSSRIQQNTVDAAYWANGLVVQHPAFPLRAIDYWQITNEVCQSWELLPNLSAFEVGRMKLAAAWDYRCAILGFSVGNPHMPENDRLAYWRQVYPALEAAEDGGHVVCLHQYGYPDLWGPQERGGADWFIHRLEHQVLPRLPFSRVRFAVTEFGIDGLIDGPRAKGWQEITYPAGYAGQLTQIGQYLERFSERVLGYTVFTLGTPDAQWASYDIAGECADGLAAYYDDAGGDSVVVVERWDEDLDALRVVDGKIMGLKAGVLAAGAQPGQTYFRLVSAMFIDEVDAKGQHVLSVDVVDENGRRLDGTKAEHGWPWEQWPAKDESVVDTVYGAHLAQWGIYAEYDPGKKEYGPYWVRVQGAPSDVFYGMGLPWKRHVSWALVFQRTVKAQPEPEPDPDAPWTEQLRNEAWKEIGVRYNPDAGFVKYARDHDLGQPVRDFNEIDRTIKGTHFRLQGFSGAIVYAEVPEEGQPWVIEAMDW